MGSIQLQYKLDTYEIDIMRDLTDNTDYLDIDQLLTIVKLPHSVYDTFLAQCPYADTPKPYGTPLGLVVMFFQYCLDQQLQSARIKRLFVGRPMQRDLDRLFKEAGHIEVRRVLSRISEGVFYRAYVDAYGDTYLEYSEVCRLVGVQPSTVADEWNSLQKCLKSSLRTYTGHICGDDPEDVPDLQDIKTATLFWLHEAVSLNQQAMNLVALIAAAGIENNIVLTYVQDQANT